MANEFDKIPSEPTLPAINLGDASKTQLAEEFADALRAGYTEADLRVRAIALIDTIIALAKSFL